MKNTNKLYREYGMVSDMETMACVRATRWKGKVPEDTKRHWIGDMWEQKPAVRVIEVFCADGSKVVYEINCDEEICSFREALKYWAYSHSYK